MDAVRVRKREDPHEGVEEATAHTSLNLEEKYRLATVWYQRIGSDSRME